MSNCGLCENCNKEETKDYGAKCYCEHYGIYVDPGEVSDCPNYK